MRRILAIAQITITRDIILDRRGSFFEICQKDTENRWRVIPFHSIKIDFTIIVFVAVLFIFTLLHEAFHAVFIPGFIHSEKTSWGIAPFGGFVSTTEELSKSRYIVISLAPYIFLALLAPAILGLSGLLNKFIFAIFINALGSSVDFVSAALVIFQVPSDSRIINNGTETFYKKAK
jgi:hypothetical protein